MKKKQTDLQQVKIPTALHRALKLAAAKAGVGMTELATQILAAELKPSAK